MKTRNVVAAWYADRVTTDRDEIARIVSCVHEVVAELQKLGLWSSGDPPPRSPGAMYGGLSFAGWLQFVYLPAVDRFVRDGVPGQVPPVRIGIAALRNYDYFDYLEGSGDLIDACRRLDEGLSRRPHAFAEKPW